MNRSATITSLGRPSGILGKRNVRDIRDIRDIVDIMDIRDIRNMRDQGEVRDVRYRGRLLRVGGGKPVTQNVSVRPTSAMEPAKAQLQPSLSF